MASAYEAYVAGMFVLRAEAKAAYDALTPEEQAEIPEELSSKLEPYDKLDTYFNQRRFLNCYLVKNSMRVLEALPWNAVTKSNAFPICFTASRCLQGMNEGPCEQKCPHGLADNYTACNTVKVG
jgi:hypothetical protein